MMKLAAVLVGVVVGISPLASAANEVDPRGPEAQAEALQYWRERIANAPNLPSEEAIPLLAACVFKTSLRSIFQSDERWEVHYAAQKALLAIPGHAEFYAKKLEEARRKVDEAEGLKKGMERSNLLAEQMYSFDKLGLMPSPETVRVLGEYLFDERGRDPNAKPGGDYGLEKIGESPNSTLALRAIAQLPLVSRPVQTPWDRTHYWNDLEPWKLWYQQVKAGTRTFRFEGDPREYNLAGPVSEAREPKGGERAADSKEVPVAPAEAEKKAVGLAVWPLTIAGMLLAAAVWPVMRRKSVAS
jgi:hypothetical protein